MYVIILFGFFSKRNQAHRNLNISVYVFRSINNKYSNNE